MKMTSIKFDRLLKFILVGISFLLLLLFFLLELIFFIFLAVSCDVMAAL